MGGGGGEVVGEVWGVVRWSVGGGGGEVVGEVWGVVRWSVGGGEVVGG